MQVDVEERVFSILANKSGLKREQMTTQSRLLQDLSLDGDDADEILFEVSKEFSMDVSGFDASEYFHAEPNLFSIFREFLPMRKARVSPKKEMTIGQLIDAARQGRLNLETSGT